jgi:putative transposase
MADLFLLSRAQMRRIERYFPLSHEIARVDDLSMITETGPQMCTE